MEQPDGGPQEAPRKRYRRAELDEEEDKDKLLLAEEDE